LIGIDAIPPRGGNSGDDIQSLRGCGALSYLDSPIGIIVFFAGGDMIIVGGCGAGFMKIA
jgi:hypothetical protein